MNKITYSYDGPVYHFGKIVCEHWKASTIAVSKEKALSNMAYRYKLANGLVSSAKINLDIKHIKEEL